MNNSQNNMTYYGHEPEQTRHLSEYIYILSKHKLLISAALLIAITLAVLHNSRLKPVYRATATMVIESEPRRSPLTGQVLDYESFYSGNLSFNTHAKLMTSRPVMERVIRDLKMAEIESYEELEISPWRALLSRVKENIRLLLGKKEKNPVPSEKRPKLRRVLARKISIQPVKDTRLLRISVEDQSPILAQKTANALAKTYIQFNIENRMKSSRNTLSWMTDQLYEMKKKLEDAEEEFLAFKQREKLFSITGKQQVTSQKIQDFNNTYVETRNRRLEVEARLAQLDKTLQPGANILYARSLIESSLVDSLYRQLLDAEVERSRLSKVFKVKHPKMIQLETKITKTEKKLQEEVKKEVDNLKAQRSLLLAREKVLQKTISDFENEALGTNRKELKYTILERNVATYQKLYDTLLSKVKESNILDTVDASGIRLAEEAALPGGPINPNKRRNLLYGVLLGLMIGMGLAFLWEYLDRSLRTEEDVQRYIGLPVLSVVPKTKAKNLKELNKKRKRVAQAGGQLFAAKRLGRPPGESEKDGGQEAQENSKEKSRTGEKLSTQ